MNKETFEQIVRSNTIFRCVAGSHSYGTNLPTSDSDERGVYIAPPQASIVAVEMNVDTEQFEHHEEDEIIFELNKFVRLACACNPNILELLFTEAENILYMDWPFKEIRAKRDMFLSKKILPAFSGYAKSQLHRIKGHKKWIQNPQPVEHPRFSDFSKFIGLDGSITTDGETIRKLSAEHFIAETFGATIFRVYSSPEFFGDKLGFFTDDDEQIRPINVTEDVLKERATYKGILIVNSNEFKKQHVEWRQYWDWKKNRNPQRAELEEKHTYDSKHAMHLVRLMKMCEELLTTGTFHVRRPDAQELLSIRNGKFSYDELIQWADETDLRLKELCDKSHLTSAVDYDNINEMYRDIVVRYWKEKGLL